MFKFSLRRKEPLDPTRARQRRNLIIAIVGASVLILGSLSFVIGGTSRKTTVDTKTVSTAADRTTNVDGTTDPNDPTATTRVRGGNGGGAQTDAERQAARAERQAAREKRQAEAQAQRQARQNGSTTSTDAPVVEETTTTLPTTTLPTTMTTSTEAPVAG
jgi:uncharacterized membrane protein